MFLNLKHCYPRVRQSICRYLYKVEYGSASIGQAWGSIITTLRELEHNVIKGRIFRGMGRLGESR
jgi:hypothetical protein